MYKVKYYKYLQKGGTNLTGGLVLGIFEYLPEKDIIKIIKSPNMDILKEQLKDVSEVKKNNKYWHAVLNETDNYIEELFENIHTLKEYTYLIDTVCWSNNNSNLICFAGHHEMWIWDFKLDKLLVKFESISSNKIYVSSLCWSNDSSNLICTGSDATVDCNVRIWDATSGKCLKVLKGHTDRVNSVCWSNDGSNRICSGSGDELNIFNENMGDNTIRIWDIESEQCLTVLKGHTFAVTSVCWSPTGNHICSGSCDETVRIWELTETKRNEVNGKCIMVLKGHNSHVNSVCWNNDNLNYICSAGNDKNVLVWDVTSGKCIIVLKGHEKAITSVCWSNDGSNRICSGSDDNTLRIWNTLGQCLRVLKAHTDSVNSVCWSPSENLICSVSGENMRSIMVSNRYITLPSYGDVRIWG